MKVVINKCFGGFGLSQLAYEKLIEYGIPVREYIEEKRNPETGLYDLNENGDEKDIYTGGSTPNKYWEVWTNGDRTNKLLIKVVEELGKKADGRCAELKIVEIPDDIEFEIEEYDGIEHIAEVHKTWS